MATFTASWTEGTVYRTQTAVAASGGTDTTDVDIATSGYFSIVAQIELDIGTTPTGSVLIEIFGSSDSGTNDDTEPLIQRTVPFTAVAIKRVSIPIRGIPYVAIRVTNNTNQSCDYTGRLAGVKQVSA